MENKSEFERHLQFVLSAVEERRAFLDEIKAPENDPDYINALAGLNQTINGTSRVLRTLYPENNENVKSYIREIDNKIMAINPNIAVGSLEGVVYRGRNPLQFKSMAELPGEYEVKIEWKPVAWFQNAEDAEKYANELQTKEDEECGVFMSPWLYVGTTNLGQRAHLLNHEEDYFQAVTRRVKED